MEGKASMNIMLFSRIIAWSGVGNHISQLARELSKAGHNVIVVSSTNDRKIGQGNGNEKFFFLSPITLNPVNILKGIQKLYRIIIEEKIEVVHCHHRMAALYMQAYNLFYKVPVVYTLHLADVPSDFFHRKMTFFGDQAIVRPVAIIPSGPK